VSTRDTASTHTTAQNFYLIWWETLKAATSSKGCLKVNKLMHTVCKFTYFPWQAIANGFKSLKPFISNCDLERFSEIQSFL